VGSAPAGDSERTREGARAFEKPGRRQRNAQVSGSNLGKIREGNEGVRIGGRRPRDLLDLRLVACYRAGSGWRSIASVQRRTLQEDFQLNFCIA
jgi:hypothetical protein